MLSKIREPLVCQRTLYGWAVSFEIPHVAQSSLIAKVYDSCKAQQAEMASKVTKGDVCRSSYSIDHQLTPGLSDEF